MHTDANTHTHTHVLACEKETLKTHDVWLLAHRNRNQNQNKSKTTKPTNNNKPAQPHQMNYHSISKQAYIPYSLYWVWQCDTYRINNLFKCWNVWSHIVCDVFLMSFQFLGSGNSSNCRATYQRQIEITYWWYWELTVSRHEASIIVDIL